MRQPMFVLPLLLLAPGCMSMERYAKSEAFATCKSRTGDAFDRCMEREEERVVVETTRKNEACQEEIDAQADRAAMIDGRRAGSPDTRAAGFDCGASAASGML
ncbi:hypothetical protein HK107_11485 [Parvularcula sp. ZS-1/3]|uniref:Lipoprotein n=1 Tax=Parvularcula mediterranea TaxID=2732508 RepID=A0A7Y3W653_9PROT|nr:hypothetical protein [Parvularcula mediterranea]NNU16941.1 hypothetical protein [Parvularcula mediterranea]